jgi:hypothetical protein
LGNSGWALRPRDEKNYGQSNNYEADSYSSPIRGLNLSVGILVT